MSTNVPSGLPTGGLSSVLERATPSVHLVRDSGRPQVVSELGGRSITVEHLRALYLSWPTADSTSRRKRREVAAS
jgi:hypothetical protein